MNVLWNQPWGVWRRQIMAVLRLEVKKNFLGRRAIFLYLLAMAPLFPISLLLLATLLGDLEGPMKELGPTMVFAHPVFQYFILLALYVGCVWIFMNLIRGEVLDGSLHYYFLVPIRREVLVAGKFLSGWVAATVLFGGVWAVSFILIHAVFGIGEAKRYLLDGPGLGQLVSYVGVAALGCLGYGAVFLLVGLFFRNPIVPAFLILGWEVINHFLPAALKKISVIHYLYSLRPIAVSEGAFAILTEPTPAYLAVPGLMLFSALALAIAGLMIRHMEIQYSSD